jgi:PAS domain S-box-containing protein
MIQQILRDNPKGMTVTDISRKLNINRNSVAKYLDIMRISGLVELITFGPAKVFFPARRVPITNMLNYTYDYIVVFDKDLKIVMINDPFLKLIDSEREEILGENVGNTILELFENNVDLSLGINEALEGKGFTKEFSLENEGKEQYFNVKIVSTAFEDGERGVTLIMKNETELRQIQKVLDKKKKKLRDFVEHID